MSSVRLLACILLATFSIVLSNYLQAGTYNFTNDRHLDKSLKCLADNIYYEAGNQSIVGKIAVAYTTLNRVISSDFPNTICGVVYERNKRTCQFSWVCQSRKYKKIVGQEKEVYNVSRQVAIAIIFSYNKNHDPSLGALYYHANYVNPRWKKRKLVQIDDHIFYR